MFEPYSYMTQKNTHYFFVGYTAPTSKVLNNKIAQDILLREYFTCCKKYYHSKHFRSTM